MNRKRALITCKRAEAVKRYLLLETNSSCTNYARSFENPAGISLHFYVFKIRHFIRINRRKKNFKNQRHIRQPHSCCSLRTSGWYLSAGVFIHCRAIPCKMRLKARFGSCALLCWYSCAAPNGGAVLLGICWEPSAVLSRACSALLGK